MAAGLTDQLLSMADPAEMVDSSLLKLGQRDPCKKRLAAWFSSQ